MPTEDLNYVYNIHLRNLKVQCPGPREKLNKLNSIHWSAMKLSENGLCYKTKDQTFQNNF